MAKDGIRYPSIDQLINRTKSKYKLAIGAALRARQIAAGEEALVQNPQNVKPIGVALEEVYENKIEIK